MAGFSSSVLLADLDYIAPSQQCVLPMMQQQAAAQKNGDEQQQVPGEEAVVTIHNNSKRSLLATGGGGGVTSSNNASAPPPLEKVQITLQDCLACSGCVTSAETILITNQSRVEVERISGIVTNNNNSSNNKLKVDDAGEEGSNNNSGTTAARQQLLVTLSEQSISAAAVEWNCSFETAANRISAFCRSEWGATAVVPLGWAQAVSTFESAAEFARRVEDSSSSSSSSSCDQKKKKQLPLIVSSCPGWVCYCEKTHASLLPLMCPVMSAQAIAGKFFKKLHSSSSHHRRGEETTASSSSTQQHAFHISVQPCFDKKLEAVRPEFRLNPPDAGQRISIAEKQSKASSAVVDAAAAAAAATSSNSGSDEGLFTDCVLSTKELLDWIAETKQTPQEEGQTHDASTTGVEEDNNNNKKQKADRFSVSQGIPLSMFPLNDITKRNSMMTDHDAADAPSSSSSLSNFSRFSTVSGGYHLAAMAMLAKQRGLEKSFDLADVQYTERRGNRNFRIATHPLLLRDWPPSTSHQNNSNSGEGKTDADDSSASQPRPPALLQFALVYGFQHIQNIVRAFSSSASAGKKPTPSSRVKNLRLMKKSSGGSSSSAAVDAPLNPSEDFCFIEMMACPGGCTNGGGQLLQMLDPDVHQVRQAQIDKMFSDAFWEKQKAELGSGVVAPQRQEEEEEEASKKQKKDDDDSAASVATLFAAKSFYEQCCCDNNISSSSSSSSVLLPGSEDASAAVRATFMDRRQDFDEKLNGGFVSLKW